MDVGDHLMHLTSITTLPIVSAKVPGLGCHAGLASRDVSDFEQPLP